MTVYLLMDELYRLVARYEKGDKEYREKVFPIIVKAVLKALGEDKLVEEIEYGKRDPYLVARDLVEKYFTFKHDPLVSIVEIRKLAKTTGK